jgi:ribosomal protein S14
MLSLKIKELKNINLYLKNEKKKIICQFLFIYFLNKENLKKKKLYFIYLLLRNNKETKFTYRMKTKLVRRCLISNRSRSSYRPFNISRFFFKKFYAIWSTTWF